MRRLRLYENDVEYTPEMLQKFVDESLSTITKLRELTKKFRNKALNISVGEVIDNPGMLEDLIEKLNTSISFAEKKYNEYFNIADNYEFGRYKARPDNINKIENNAMDIDHLVIDLKSIKDVLDNLQDGAKYMSRLSVKDED